MKFMAACLLMIAVCIAPIFGQPEISDGYQTATYEQKSDEVFEDLVKQLKQFS